MEANVWAAIEGIVQGIQEEVDVDVYGSWAWEEEYVVQEIDEVVMGGWRVELIVDSPTGNLIGGYVLISNRLLERQRGTIFEVVGRQFGRAIERIILNELGC